MAIVLSALKTEIESDPRSLGYAGMANDKEVSNKLNELGASGENVVEPISMITLLQWLASSGVIDRLERQKTEHVTEGIRAICHAALRMIDRQDLAVIDLTNPMNAGMIDALVADGVVMSSAEKASLLGLTTRSGSRCEVLFGVGTSTTPSIVADAKALP